MFIKSAVIILLFLFLFSGNNNNNLRAGGTYMQRVSCDTKSRQAFWYTKKKYDKKEFERAKELIEKYSEGGGFTALMPLNRGKKYCKKEGDSMMNFVNTSFIKKIPKGMKFEGVDMGKVNESAFFMSMGFIVHEETHAFTSQAKYDMFGKHKKTVGKTVYFEIPSGMRSSFYLEGWGTHHVPHIALYDSNEITKILPANKFNVMRYKTYILGTKDGAARQDGMYGLLNEYHAYYHGTTFVNNLYKAGVDKSYANEYTAFAEFSLFILKYLEYAKTKYPRVYKSNMAQKLLMETFVRIHDKYESVFCERASLINKHDDIIANYKNIGKVTYKGHTCSVSLNVYKTTGKTTFYNNAKELQNYLTELQTPAMINMMKEVRKASGVK